MRRLFHDWLFYVILWSVVTIFYTYIVLSMMLSIIEYLDVSDQVLSEPTVSYMVSNYQYVEALLFGILFGTATFGINLAVDYTTIHKLSFGKTIIIKTLLYFFAIAVIFVLMAGIIMTSGLSPLSPEQYSEFIFSNPLPASFYLVAGVFFIISTLLINFIALEYILCKLVKST